ncbi:MAG TPA: CsbD family protein [Acidimicrobiales bacterium]|nr:CsbD family protein [Acidimicrobiales bacterium]
MGKKDKARNTVQVAKGKVKEATGRTIGDESLEASGRTDQMKGNLKQAGEKVKDALQE